MSVSRSYLWRFRLWLARKVLPNNVALFGAGEWKIREQLVLKEGQVISGVGKDTVVKGK